MSLILLLLLLNGCGGVVPTAIAPPESGSSANEPSLSDVSPLEEKSASSENEQDGNAQVAQETVARFMAAIQATDIDALTQLTDVPFPWEGRIFAKAEELRPQFARMLEKKELLSKLTFEVREIIAFETIREKAGGEVGEFLKRNLNDGDQIVIADILLPEKKADRHVHYVRIRGGKASIIALLDAPLR